MIRGTNESFFKFEDVEEWKAALDKEGFAVLRGVLSKKDVDHATGSLWTSLERLGSGLNRKDPATWTNEAWPGWKQVGFLQTNGLCQSEAAWYVRSHPNVVKAFAEIWGTEDLITSLDVIIAWRPWKKQPSRRPRVERLHVDQNAYAKRGKVCVQGMVVLEDVTVETGGLQVVPGTNTDEVQSYLRRTYPHLASEPNSDWCELDENDPFIGKGELLLAKAGDLILWDSRTIHAGYVGPGSDDESKLSRLAMTVCMIPQDKVNPKVLEMRMSAFQLGKCLTHWPGEYREHSTFGTIFDAPPFVPPQLTGAQLRLLAGAQSKDGQQCSLQ